MLRPSTSPPSALIRRHLLLGWAGLLVVVASGMILEGLHAFKVDAYLLVGHDTRRLMWRLAHAHAGLLCLIQLAYAATLPTLPRIGKASLALISATFLIPLGFFLGGLGAVGADPSFGVLLVPLGALVLLTGLGQITAEALRPTNADPSERADERDAHH